MTRVSGDVEVATAERPGRRRNPLLRLIDPVLQPAGTVFGAVQSGARTMEVDLRLTGMIVALVFIWLVFNLASGGTFLTPRNFYDICVQSTAVAIMATGMVLVIVSRNIDLSVGSIMGLTGYVAAMTQRIWLTEDPFHLPYGGFEIWIIALLVAIAVGALIGAIQGGLVAYIGIPSFIVTLAGLLVWRGLIFKLQQGMTIAPMDKTFSIIGGGLPLGAMGFWPTWIIGLLACAGIIYALIASRRKRREYGFPVRPRWALVTLIVGGCAAVIAGVIAFNSYPLPPLLATQYAKDNGIIEPTGGLIIPVGLAFPVLILLAVMLGMMYLATRRQFGRKVYAIGGNPEAAELAGINTRRTILGTFVLLGMLCALAGCIQAARLDAGVTSAGTSYELLVIAAAVLGGTSLAGGIGTIPGAVLGAFVMQSLKSGMSSIGWDSSMQDVAIGSVLVIAVGLDIILRRRVK